MSDTSYILAAMEKRRGKLAKWLAVNPDSSQRESMRNPQHARMLVQTSGEQMAIPEPAIDVITVGSEDNLTLLSG